MCAVVVEFVEVYRVYITIIFFFYFYLDEFEMGLRCEREKKKSSDNKSDLNSLMSEALCSGVSVDKRICCVGKALRQSE